MNIKEQLRKIRKEKNMTQEQIAGMIHVSRQTISNWENGKSYPDIESLILLSDIYKVSLDELVRGDVKFMKKEVMKNEMEKYSKAMLFFGILAILSFVGISKVPRYSESIRIAITLIFSIFMLFFAFKIEKIKKDKNIRTYNEILTYLNENSK